VSRGQLQGFKTKAAESAHAEAQEQQASERAAAAQKPPKTAN
jgi:hypothetical protein